MRAFVLLALLGALVGCNSREIELDPKFFPLTSVREVTDDLPFLAKGAVTTIYSTSYTKDLRALGAAYPVGSVEWDALFFHEREHTIRELQNPFFFVQYGLSLSIRWEEEQLGYAAEIKHLRANGRYVDVERYVATLSGPLYHGMVDEAVARVWVLSRVR